ncbi:hypothetical protein GN956_G1148 [Arapaima gigas]
MRTQSPFVTTNSTNTHPFTQHLTLEEPSRPPAGTALSWVLWVLEGQSPVGSHHCAQASIGPTVPPVREVIGVAGLQSSQLWIVAMRFDASIH